MWQLEFNATLKGDRAILKYIGFDGSGARYVIRQRTIKGSFRHYTDLYDHVDCVAIGEVNKNTIKYKMIVE